MNSQYGSKTNKNRGDETMYYVYRFLDKSNQIVYVGKTGYLKKRMTEHFSKQGHLTKGQYEQVEKIEYVELAFHLDMDFLEKYLINLWKPPFNSVDKDSDITLFSFNNAPLKWKNFDKKEIVNYPHLTPSAFEVEASIK